MPAGCPDASFDRMKSIEERLTRVKNMGPEMLGNFYDDELKSFAVVPGTTSRFSVTSTCFALQAILSGPEAWAGTIFTSTNSSLRETGQSPLSGRVARARFSRMARG